MTPQAQATAHALLDAALAEDPRLMRHHIDDLTPTEQQTVMRALKTAVAMTDSCRWRQPMPPRDHTVRHGEVRSEGLVTR